MSQKAITTSKRCLIRVEVTWQLRQLGISASWTDAGGEIADQDITERGQNMPLDRAGPLRGVLGVGPARAVDIDIGGHGLGQGHGLDRLGGAQGLTGLYRFA